MYSISSSQPTTSKQKERAKMNLQKTESKKPTGSPIVGGLDQAEKAPWRMCPLMSRCQAVVMPSHSPGGPPIISGPKITSLNMEVPCMGPRCQWWIPEWESCCVRGIATIREVAAALEPTSWKKNLKTLEGTESSLNGKIKNLTAEVERLRVRLQERGGE
jgi:hypothetical protein